MPLQSFSKDGIAREDLRYQCNCVALLLSGGFCFSGFFFLLFCFLFNNCRFGLWKPVGEGRTKFLFFSLPCFTVFL